MTFDPKRLMFGRAAPDDAVQSPLAGERRMTAKRLQVGLLGIGAMILLVGLANIIMNGVKETQATVVPEAAPPVVVTEAEPPPRDPLADAGVVPDLPADPDAPTEQVPATAAPPAPNAVPPRP